MPGPNEQAKKPQFTSYESPFHEGNVNESGDWDPFLESFQNGIVDNEAGRNLIESVRSNSYTMMPPLENLFRQGLFGGRDAFPTVEEVMRDGRRITIVEADGTLTTYTDKYLMNNPTVASLRQMEGDQRGSAGYGRVLLGHLGLFLGGKGKADLKNYEKAFGSQSPADPKSRIGVYIDTPNGMQMVTDKTTLDTVNREKDLLEKAGQEHKKLEEELAKKTSPVEAKEQELKTAAERRDRLYHEELPPFPRERNAFRRFFTRIHLAPHSEQYNKDMEKYNTVKRMRAPYEKRQKEYEELLKKEPTLESLKAEQKAAQDRLDEKIQADLQAAEAFRNENRFAEEKAEWLTEVSDRVRVIQREDAQQAYEAKTSEETLRHKLEEPGALDKVTSSKAVQFSKGSVGAMLDIINNRAAIDAEMKKDTPQLDERNRQIWEKAKRLAKDNPKLTVQEGVEIDNTPYNDINKLVTLTDYLNASKFAQTVESEFKDQAEEDARKGLEPRDYSADKRHTFDKLARTHYETMVKSSQKCFQEVFDLEPTVENVQTVIKSVNLDKYVKQGIRQIDGTDYEPEGHALPPVSEENVGDMTLLLMSGIKTAVMGPQKGPDIQAEQEGPQQAITNYRPLQQQAEGPQPGGPEL